MRYGRHLPFAARHLDIHQQGGGGKDPGIAIHQRAMFPLGVLAANGQTNRTGQRGGVGMQQLIDIGHNRYRAPVVRRAIRMLWIDEYRRALDERPPALHQADRASQYG